MSRWQFHLVSLDMDFMVLQSFSLHLSSDVRFCVSLNINTCKIQSIIWKVKVRNSCAQDWKGIFNFPKLTDSDTRWDFCENLNCLNINTCKFQSIIWKGKVRNSSAHDWKAIFNFTKYDVKINWYMMRLLWKSQSVPITSVRRSWPMQIVKGSLYVMIELLKMTDVSKK